MIRKALNFGVAASFLALLCGLPACRKPQASPLIEKGDLQIRLGTADAVDPRRWALLQVEVKNQGQDFRGVLEVEGETWEEVSLPPLYRLDLEVPGRASTVRQVALPVRPEGWSRVRLTFRQPGYVRSFRWEVPPGDEARCRVLVVGEEWPDLTALKKRIEDYLVKEANATTAPVQITRIRSRDLPAIPLAYDPFQLVLLWGSSFLDAPLGALEALTRWVEAGGTLAAFTGPDWAGGPPPQFLELLGVSIGDPRALPPPATAGFYRQLLPATGTREIAGGLAFRSARGAGSVTAFAFRPDTRAFPDPHEAPLLHEALRPALARAASLAGNAGAGLHEIERQVAGRLFEMSGFQVPERSAVALSLLVYLAIGFLLPALVFNRLRRREWTFPVVVLAAAAATWAIYRYGLLSPISGLELEEITVLRLHHDGKAAEATSYLGFISPSLTSLDPRPACPALPQGLRAEMPTRWGATRPLPVPPATLQADTDGSLRFSPLTLHPNGMRYLRYDYRISLEEAPGTYRGQRLLPVSANLDPLIQMKRSLDLPAESPAVWVGRPEQPRYEAAVAHEPVFPLAARVARRKAKVYVLRELPPEMQ